MRIPSTFFLAVVLLGTIVKSAGGGTAAMPVAGIETGMFQAAAYLTSYDFRETYTDSAFAATSLYHGFAFCGLNFPPQQALAFLAFKSQATQTAITISYIFRTTMYRSFTVCWAVSAMA